jgi:hypothetical protein
MSTVVVVELTRLGWSRKIVRKSFVVLGCPPYASSLKLQKVGRKVVRNKKSRKKPNVGEIWASSPTPFQ